MHQVHFENLLEQCYQSDKQIQDRNMDQQPIHCLNLHIHLYIAWKDHNFLNLEQMKYL